MPSLAAVGWNSVGFFFKPWITLVLNSEPLSIWTHSILMPWRLYHFTARIRKLADEYVPCPFWEFDRGSQHGGYNHSCETCVKARYDRALDYTAAYSFFTLAISSATYAAVYFPIQKILLPWGEPFRSPYAFSAAPGQDWKHPLSPAVDKHRYRTIYSLLSLILRLLLHISCDTHLLYTHTPIYFCFLRISCKHSGAIGSSVWNVNVRS